ncbi:GNAT family N-acetyltransferase [Actinomyces israelii]|uniref:GNAT family N-acetyltransferase n=1 Tax=Actinomyces israelii TaxID=1659 RepID=UPI0023566ADF|nr:GNAT family N-acetyltransferase [Actinomyces israelii]
MTLSTTHPGFPDLLIPPVSAAVEPYRFETCAGDAADPAAQSVRAGIADVRLEVFVAEQDVPLALEIDARDDEPTTIHVLARGADGAPLAAGRLLADPGRPGLVHLGRLAVRRVCRGTGLGVRMVATIEDAARRRAAVAQEDGGAAVTVMLSAQEQAMGFYERCGYTVVGGERYLDAGIWHQDMARTVFAPAVPGRRRAR